ncbi:MAG: glycosyltransferase family 4 protein [Rhodobiaceae bacterium]|nr:glycosyltransferase family 4 protein [Rhodobiaceae bacterium]
MRDGAPARATGGRVLFLATEDWYFAGHRLGLARAALDAGYDVSVATRVRAHARVIGDAGVRLLTLEWARRSLNPLRLFHEAQAIRDFVDSEKPSIIHCVSLRTIVAACLGLRRLPRQRAVFAFTGLGYLFVGRAVWKRLARRAIGRLIGDAAGRHDVVLLFENDDDRARIVSLAGRADIAAETNPGSGVDMQRFAILPATGNDAPVFAFAGRMLRIKGVGELIAASRELTARGVAHEVVLAGGIDPDNRSGIGESELVAMMSGAPVRWLGPVDDIRSVWVRADVCVAPSHGGEGVPLSLVEAAACGRALIASDVAGCRDVVIDGETGVLVAPGDAAALADAMQRFAGDEAERVAMGRRAAALVREKFSRETVNARTLALYRRMLGGNAGGSA